MAGGKPVTLVACTSLWGYHQGLLGPKSTLAMIPTEWEQSLLLSSQAQFLVSFSQVWAAGQGAWLTSTLAPWGGDSMCPWRNKNLRLRRHLLPQAGRRRELVDPLLGGRTSQGMRAPSGCQRQHPQCICILTGNLMKTWPQVPMVSL